MIPYLSSFLDRCQLSSSRTSSSRCVETIKWILPGPSLIPSKARATTRPGAFSSTSRHTALVPRYVLCSPIAWRRTEPSKTSIGATVCFPKTVSSNKMTTLEKMQILLSPLYYSLSFLSAVVVWCGKTETVHPSKTELARIT